VAACLHNRYFPKLEDVTTAVERTSDGWRRETRPSGDYAQLLRALCLGTFHRELELIVG
jgi:hypothetical protein